MQSNRVMTDHLNLGFHFIDGEWCSNHQLELSINVLSPATEAIIGTIKPATDEEVSQAVQAARKSFPSWRDTSRIHRADLFDKLGQLIKRDHDKFKTIISQETGKNLNESHAEVIEALHMCQVSASMGRQSSGQTFASELATKDVQVVRKPKGVVAIISPWNFPLAIGSFWCAGPALVEGNTVVHKPSELTPFTNQLAAELYEEAGFPPGVFNLIHGAEATGKALVTSDVDVILFTGSATVGQEIRRHCADTWHKTCSCEMGSKSAVIVFDDGCLDLAVDVSLASAFKLSGQRCVSSGRILVQRSGFEDFKNAFVDRTQRTVRPADPFNVPEGFDFTFGPLVSREQADRVMKFNDMVKEDSDAKVLLDYHSLSRSGYFLTPFVYECEWGDKPFLKQEVFGPHVALVPFNDLDDAIRIYNDTDYGLALGVVTDDFRKHRRLRDECNTGMLYINGSSIGAESHLPFGGVGKSGNGWKSAVGTVDAVTDKISVTTNFEEGRMRFAQGMK